MAIQLPKDAEVILDRTLEFNFDNCKVLAYRLQGLSSNDLTLACEKATESYARQALNWPKGRIEKPEIFDMAGGSFEDIGACIQHFIHHLQGLLDSDPPKMLPSCSMAFVVFSKDGLPDHASLVLFHTPDGREWRVDSFRCPVEAELGVTVTSLTMGDEVAEDVLGRLGNRGC